METVLTGVVCPKCLANELGIVKEGDGSVYVRCPSCSNLAVEDVKKLPPQDQHKIIEHAPQRERGRGSERPAGDKPPPSKEGPRHSHQ